METRVLKIQSEKPDKELIAEAAELIRSGQLVGFPTETVYGLGADGLDGEAVKLIFQAKGRPQDNPLILHVDSVEMAEQLVLEIPASAKTCIERFWPGPLTILFKRREIVPDIITAGLDTVAIRMPSHPVALELIRQSGTPIAAPSANTSGKPSPTRAEHVLEDMDGKIPMILDGGETGVGLESTVLDLTGITPMILRPGGVTLDQIRELLPSTIIDPAIEAGQEKLIPRAPGQKYRHYAPRAQMKLVTGENNRVVNEILRLAEEAELEGMMVGIMSCTENSNRYFGYLVSDMGSAVDKETIAHRLFHIIRELDRSDVDLILCEAVGEDDIGLAIMNRLMKASGGKLVKV
jgi:L-threonylcarbamoyladenylate synthase